MQTNAYRRTLAALSLAAVAGLTAAGCGGSSTKTSSSPTTAAGSNATTATTAASSGGSSGSSSATSGSSSGSASTIDVGGNSYCNKLENFSTTLSQDLASVATSPASELTTEEQAFQSLANQAPSAIKQPMTDIANFFKTAVQAEASQNASSLEGLSGQEAQLGSDGQQIGTWVAQNCG